MLEEMKVEIENYNPDRRSWIKQQIIKTAFVYNSTLPILIVDSDTFFNPNLIFVSSSKQLLLVGDGFHFPYSRHIRKYMKYWPLPISFVHHVQLQRPEIVQEIYGSDLIKGLKLWLKTGYAKFEFSAVSEFQTYGDYLLRTRPGEVQLLFPSKVDIDVKAESLELKIQEMIEDRDKHHFVTIGGKHLR